MRASPESKRCPLRRKHAHHKNLLMIMLLWVYFVSFFSLDYFYQIIKNLVSFIIMIIIVPCFKVRRDAPGLAERTVLISYGIYYWCKNRFVNIFVAFSVSCTSKKSLFWAELGADNRQTRLILCDYFSS
jgi:hypothetical protein